MCAKVQHSICLEHMLKEGVESSKAVMWGGTAAEQQPHRVTLIAKGRLHTQEHIAKLLAIHQQVPAIGVELACKYHQYRNQLCNWAGRRGRKEHDAAVNDLTEAERSIVKVSKVGMHVDQQAS